MQMLLPALHRMVYQILKEKLEGCQVLRLLHDKAACGVPELQSCAVRLLWHCHLALLDKVRAWCALGQFLAHGGRVVIEDPNKEPLKSM